MKSTTKFRDLSPDLAQPTLELVRQYRTVSQTQSWNEPNAINPFGAEPLGAGGIRFSDDGGGELPATR